MRQREYVERAADTELLDAARAWLARRNADPPWVFMEDLEALDLWPKCEHRSPSAAPGEVERRSEQLGRASRQYVRQLSAGIREEQVQRLALDLLPARAGASR